MSLPPCTVDPARVRALLQTVGLGEVREQGTARRIGGLPVCPVQTDQGRFLIAVGIPGRDQPLRLAGRLGATLTARGLPATAPVAGDGVYPLDDAPALITTAPPGGPVSLPEPTHCAQLGETLGRLHATEGGGESGSWDRSRRLREQAEPVADRLGSEGAARLREELRFQALYRFNDLPRGTVHGHPTRPAVHFDGERLAGITGLWHSGTDTLLRDLAAAVHDWCTGEDGRLDRERARALLAGYRSIRPCRPIEQGAWPVLLRTAALQAWIAALRAREAGEADRHQRLLAHYAAAPHALQDLWR